MINGRLGLNLKTQGFRCQAPDSESCATASESSEKQCLLIFLRLRSEEHCLTQNGQAVARKSTSLRATASESPQKQCLLNFSA